LKEFENRVLNLTFKPKREEATGGWRKLLLNNLFSQNIIQAMKSIRIRCSGRVARMGHEENVQNISRKTEG
jgi:hypothetical protein